MRRGWTGPVVGGALLVAVALLTACGDDDAAGEAPPVPASVDISDLGTGPELPDTWTALGGETLAVHLDPDDVTLIIDARTTPVRLPDGQCAVEAGGWVTDEGHAEVVWVAVRTAVPNVEGPAGAALQRAQDEHGACPSEDAEVRLKAPSPIVGRDLVVDQVRWVPTGGGAYTLCALPGCDPDTGEPPARASCADESTLVEDVRTMGDVPRGAAIVERRCEDGWAMVEVDLGSDACPPSDGGPNPCAGQRVDRLFLRAGTPHWEVITRTREAGCASVAELEPGYPEALCADRPATAGG